MTDDYLSGITPDSMSGLIFGFGGIHNALVILNGPTGCKFFHSITVENQSVEKDDYDSLNWPDEWFFGQRRVPCTYLDKRDYVYGSESKLMDAVRVVLGRVRADVLAVVNSPGAALIGDDLDRIVRAALTTCGYIIDQNQDGASSGPPASPAAPDTETDAGAGRHITMITCQSPGWSRDIIDGYREACRTVIDTFCSSMPHAEHTVNLLGLSIYQKHHNGDIAEIRRLLGLCGIRVNTALLCESTPEEIRAIPGAVLNVVIDPDWGLDTAEYLSEKYKMPYVTSEYGYPVGFKAMEKLIQDICRTLSEDPAPALSELEKARAQAYVHLARMSSLTGLPKGTRFAVFGSPALRRGYSSFLVEYLGMTDVSRGFDDSGDAADSTDDKGREKTPGSVLTYPEPEVVLADGNTIARMKAEGRKFCGIEISLPSIGYIDVIDKTHLGAAGGLFLIEQILNSFTY